MITLEKHAGFWVRLLAHLIDSIAIAMPVSSFVMGFMLFILPPFLTWIQNGSGPDANFATGMAGLGAGLLLLVLPFFFGALFWLYYALMESSKWQATLGKRAVGIVVTGVDGSRISFGRASARYFSKILSGFILYIGFFMIVWTKNKQGLHDKMASTLVLVGKTH